MRIQHGGLLFCKILKFSWNSALWLFEINGSPFVKVNCLNLDKTTNAILTVKKLAIIPTDSFFSM